MLPLHPPILALDVTGDMIHTALDNGEEVFTKSIAGENRVDEKILSVMESLLTQHNYKITDLHSLLITLGPGSFTGIRIGIATMLGLAFGLDFLDNKKKKIFGINNLCAILLSHLGRGHNPQAALFLAKSKNILGGYFYQTFRLKKNTLTATMPEPLLVDDDIAQPDHIIVTGEINWRDIFIALKHYDIDNILDETLTPCYGMAPRTKIKK